MSRILAILAIIISLGTIGLLAYTDLKFQSGMLSHYFNGQEK